jgi:malonyl CoA-acyl carrier protein transacylase
MSRAFRIEDLRSNFTRVRRLGHTSREFRVSALASLANILPNLSFVDVVFYRGLTIHRAVGRDERSRSDYTMCAVSRSGQQDIR